MNNLQDRTRGCRFSVAAFPALLCECQPGHPPECPCHESLLPLKEFCFPGCQTSTLSTIALCCFIKLTHLDHLTWSSLATAGTHQSGFTHSTHQLQPQLIKTRLGLLILTHKHRNFLEYLKTQLFNHT